MRQYRTAGRDRLGDEERVATGRPVELIGVEPARTRKRRHGCLRQRLEPESLHRFDRGQLAQHDAERLVASELRVAIADENERANRADAACEQPEDIQRRGVRPVRILDNEDGRLARRQLARECGYHLMRPRIRRHEVEELSTCFLCNGEKGRKRTWREERVALAPKQPCAPAVALAEAAQQHGLASSGITADERHSPSEARTHSGERIVESGDVIRALEQLTISAQHLRHRELSPLAGALVHSDHHEGRSPKRLSAAAAWERRPRLAHRDGGKASQRRNR